VCGWRGDGRSCSEILQDLFLREGKQITRLYSRSIKQHAGESREFLRFFQDGRECCAVGDVHAPCLNFDYFANRVGGLQDGFSVLEETSLVSLYEGNFGVLPLGEERGGCDTDAWATANDEETV
jgi:hypothetical protein